MVLKNSVFMLTLVKIIQLMIGVLVLSACAHQKIDLGQESDLDTQLLKQALYAQFDAWQSVRYRLGGLSKAGVDCSGFVYLTYRDLFGVSLPRTVYQQAGSGPAVSQQQLKTGDLVFFRIGRSQNHVGIYLEHRRFLHVSSRRGVIISSLDNCYWSGKYWKAVRIISS
jgi:probable lipoprotein NlpC